jgi:hypothetical protein
MRVSGGFLHHFQRKLMQLCTPNGGSMGPKMTVREANRLLLEDFVLGELDGLVNYRTGEIVERLVYDSYPYVPCTEDIPPSFVDVASIHGLDRFMHHIDRRTLVVRNDSRRLYDADKGNHHYQGSAIGFSTQQLNKLNQLIKQLDYANSIVTTPHELAQALRIERNNVYRYLASLGALVRVITPARGMAQGTLRVDISPAYGFRYFSTDFDIARRQAVVSWYRPSLQ